MNYAVSLAPAAQRSLRKLDPAARRRIQAALDLLAIDPRPPAAVQLVGDSAGATPQHRPVATHDAN